MGKGKPHIPGIDYSSIDVNMARGDKSLIIRQKFGPLGLAMLYDVISWINENDGCYANWTEQTPTDYAMTRLYDLSLADKAREIFECMIEVGWFDQEAFRADSVLTSEKIVERYLFAKRRPRLDKMPESVRNIAERVIEKEKQNSANNTSNSANNTPNRANNTSNSANNRTKVKKSKEVQTINQTNNQDAECSAVDFPPPAGPDADEDPGPPDGAVREKVCRVIYFRGISSELVDAAAACVERGWLTLDGIRNMRRKARDSLELFEATKGRRGKERGWEVIRDCVALVYREHGLEPPVYSRNNPEPPPGPAAPAQRAAMAGT